MAWAMLSVSALDIHSFFSPQFFFLMAFLNLHLRDLPSSWEPDICMGTWGSGDRVSQGERWPLYCPLIWGDVLPFPESY